MLGVGCGDAADFLEIRTWLVRRRLEGVVAVVSEAIHALGRSEILLRHKGSSLGRVASLLVQLLGGKLADSTGHEGGALGREGMIRSAHFCLWETF